MNAANWTAAPKRVECSSDVFLAAADQFERTATMGYVASATGTTGALFLVGPSHCSSSSSNNSNANNNNNNNINNINNNNDKTGYHDTDNGYFRFSARNGFINENGRTTRTLLENRRTRSVDDDYTSNITTTTTTTIHNNNNKNSNNNNNTANIDTDFEVQNGISTEAFNKKLQQLTLNDDGDNNIKNDRPSSPQPQSTDRVKDSAKLYDTRKSGFPRIRLNAGAPLLRACNSLIIRSNDVEQQQRQTAMVDGTNDSNNVPIVSEDVNIVDEEPDYSQKLRRCSSLKTHQQQTDNEANSCSPSRKKIVRFADALGLDLADVRTFMDEIPFVPKSAYDDLNNKDLLDDRRDNDNSANGNRLDVKKYLVPIFTQPDNNKLSNFLDKIRDNFVCLERVDVDDNYRHVCFVINGTVRVRNLDFHKSVYVRYSQDGWMTFDEIQANYLANSCDGFSDQFRFVIYLYHLELGGQVEIAVRYHCKGQQYWDNNDGLNYALRCSPNRPVSNNNNNNNNNTNDQQKSRILYTPTYVLPPQSNPNGSSFY